jgi:hypothetical protein
LIVKVTYLTIGEASAGVSKKLRDKTASLRQAGLDAHLVILGTEKNELDAHVSRVQVNQSLAHKVGKLFFLWRLSVFFEQWALYRAALNWVQAHPADLILFRYPVGDFFLWRFLHCCPQRVVFEYNTIELAELKLRKSASFYYQYFYWSERIFGKAVRVRSAGIIGVTPEITEYQSKLAGGAIPSIAISNGINVERVKQRAGADFDGTELRIVLLSGSQAQWHGVDILLKSLEEVKNECKIICYIAGQITKEQEERARRIQNVIVLPPQYGEDLDKLMDQCHLGIGTLGFETSFLTQACPLKVREYWARGIPFVIAYEDADLIQNTEMQPYFLRVQIENGTIRLNEVIDFAKKVYAAGNVSIRLRSLAKEQIDYTVKAQQYVSFLHSLQA